MRIFGSILPMAVRGAPVVEVRRGINPIQTYIMHTMACCASKYQDIYSAITTQLWPILKKERSCGVAMMNIVLMVCVLFYGITRADRSS